MTMLDNTIDRNKFKYLMAIHFYENNGFHSVELYLSNNLQKCKYDARQYVTNILQHYSIYKSVNINISFVDSELNKSNCMQFLYTKEIIKSKK